VSGRLRLTKSRDPTCRKRRPQPFAPCQHSPLREGPPVAWRADDLDLRETPCFGASRSPKKANACSGVQLKGDRTPLSSASLDNLGFSDCLHFNVEVALVAATRCRISYATRSGPRLVCHHSNSGIAVHRSLDGSKQFSAWVNLRLQPTPPPNHPSMVNLGRLGGGVGWCDLNETCASGSNQAKAALSFGASRTTKSMILVVCATNRVGVTCLIRTTRASGGRRRSPGSGDPQRKGRFR
jgi:hypothetical protein